MGLGATLLAMIHPGMALKAIRKSQGKTLEDIEAILNVNTGGLSRKERGIEDIPVPLLSRWCEVLKVNPSEVYAIAENRVDGLTSDLARLVRFMSKLNVNDRAALVDQAEFLASRHKRAG